MNIIEKINKNYTETLVLKNDFLLDLINDEKLREKYFESIDVEQYTYNNYNKLLTELLKCNRRKIKKENSLLYQIYKRYCDTNILNTDDMNFMILKSKISEFDKTLGYLMFFDKISLDEAKNRGFKADYLEKVLSDCQKIATDPYQHFYSYSDTKNTEIKVKVKSNEKNY